MMKFVKLIIVIIKEFGISKCKNPYGLYIAHLDAMIILNMIGFSISLKAEEQMATTKEKKTPRKFINTAIGLATWPMKAVFSTLSNQVRRGQNDEWAGHKVRLVRNGTQGFCEIYPTLTCL